MGARRGAVRLKGLQKVKKYKGGIDLERNRKSIIRARSVCLRKKKKAGMGGNG